MASEDVLTLVAILRVGHYATPGELSLQQRRLSEVTVYSPLHSECHSIPFKNYQGRMNVRSAATLGCSVLNEEV